MDKIKLPLAQPPIVCYLHHAYTLAIALCHPQYIPWFYSNYIQWYYAATANNKFNIYSPSDIFMEFPFFTIEYSNKQILKDLNIDHKTLINRYLQEGYYFCAFVEEYHVPGKQAYKSYNLRHECLIYGYDNTNKHYHILGFDNRRIFKSSTLRYEDFDTAFWSITDSNVMMFYKVETEKKYSFDRGLVIMQLRDYLQSENTSERMKIIDKQLKCHSIWGLEVYESLKNYLISVMNGDIEFETRYIQILWEHKKSMLARLKYMYEKGYTKTDIHYEAYKDIERKFNIIRAFSLKLTFNIKNKNIFDRILPLIDTIAINEKKILENVMEEMENTAINIS